MKRGWFNPILTTIIASGVHKLVVRAHHHARKRRGW